MVHNTCSISSILLSSDSHSSFHYTTHLYTELITILTNCTSESLILPILHNTLNSLMPGTVPNNRAIVVRETSMAPASYSSTVYWKWQKYKHSYIHNNNFLKCSEEKSKSTTSHVGYKIYSTKSWKASESLREDLRDEEERTKWKGGRRAFWEEIVSQFIKFPQYLNILLWLLWIFSILDPWLVILICLLEQPRSPYLFQTHLLILNHTFWIAPTIHSVTSCF